MKQLSFPLRQATLSLLAALTLCVGSCKSGKDISPSSDYAAYVNAYTGGIISRAASIRVELTQEQPLVETGIALKDNPFSFTPSLKGEAHWVSNSVIEFTPEEGELKPGTLYETTFQLGRFAEVEKELKEFKFSFRVQERSLTLTADPVTITANTPGSVNASGYLLFSDAMKADDIKELLTAYREDDESQTYPVTITPTGRADRYVFSLDPIAMEADEFNVVVKVRKNNLDYKEGESVSITIPSKDAFKLLSARRVDEPENGIAITFSEPVSQTQDLKGLIQIQELSNYIFQVEDNKVYVYFEPNDLEKLTLVVHPGVRSMADKKLLTTTTLSFSEQRIKPQVRIGVDAAILPDSKNLILPFRAVNLYAVDLSVVRIFEKNVLMFMQTNTLAGSGELRRSGRMVYKKTLWLNEDGTKDLHQWQDYSIDLSGLIRQEPGAIYRVYLTFSQEYSAYPCAGAGDEGKKSFAKNIPSQGMVQATASGLTEDDEETWDTPEAYYYYSNPSMDWSEYSWRERDNPCHASYYMTNDRIAQCNVFASNLGLIVKKNSAGQLWATVTDMLTAQPVSGATVTAYNFQLQPIAQGTTDGSGFARLALKGQPFIVTAEVEKQKAYVRVVDGEELSTSRFDVGGKEIRKGLKGFVYGERGVWRPGDTLHVTFMLEDREKRIPDRHPVTLELYNPQGQFYTKQVVTKGTNGFYVFNLATKADDPTGVWNAYVKVGGTAFHKSLRIETIKPNRLKINLDLPQLLDASSGQINAPLSAAWLTGATASNLKAKVEMSLTRANTQFKNYNQYLFNNPATDFTSTKEEVYDGSLDAGGKANVVLKLPESGNAPGMLNATLTTRVFEPGGDASFFTQSVPFSPFSSYVGINLNEPKGKYIETDRDHTFDVVTINPKGQPVNRSGLEYKIYRIDWSWWWENSDNRSFDAYINSSSITPVATGKLNTQGGKASFTFRVNYPDWGRYLVYVKDPDSGHATGGTVYIDWPDWRGRSSRKDPSGVKMLTFSLDKETYAAGDKATAIIPAAAGGRALASIENGTTILKQEWIDIATEGDTKYTFDITPEMAPNAYLHISLLQPHTQTVNDLPIRMYGVVPVLVVNKETELRPQIDMVDVLRPEADFDVTVSEKSGKPMTYTLAIVDDGLLDLTNFRTPDPWNEFYAREALGIRTWDMYDNVLGATAGKYASLFSTGGDATLKPADAKANRFKPVVKFVGPFALGKGEKRKHALRLPMYVGSVRVMVVAGQEGAYGNAEKTVPVRTPLMLLSTLPRTISINEEITVPVNVFAMEDKVKNATATIQVKGAGVTVTGAARQSLTFAKPGDQLAYFTLRTGNQTGKATISLAASGNGEQAKETVEIDVRNPNPAVNLRDSRWIEAGQSAELGYSLAPSSGGNQVTLEVSRLPSVDLTRRFDFLYDYQHLCTEQLTSKGLPLLFVAQFKEVDSPENEKIKKNVEEAVQRVYSRQLSNGGFAYWPGDAVANEWVSSYAGMFLVLAQEKGYAVQPYVLTRWKNFQRAAARNWSPSQGGKWRSEASELTQAFRLYTLALAGIPEQGAMNRMKEQKGLSLSARWRLAASYALTGKMKPAEELIFGASTQVDENQAMDYTFGSSERDEAMILETLILMKRHQEALEQAKRVSAKLSNESWFSTQSTAFALVAMGRLAESISGTIDLSWSLNGKQQPQVKSAKAVFEKAIASPGQSGKIALKNQGTGALSADLVVRTQLLNDTLPAIQNGLRMEVTYANAAGTAMSVEEIGQGTDFTATVTVTNIGAAGYTDLALTHILPSGWEIINARNAANTYTYQDVRDDRVLTYFDLPQGATKRVTVRLNATYIGAYTLPAVQCEAMYDANVQARTRAGKTRVTK
ncbi:MAG: alpha-2-macroglobulin [Mediterranea sp.]|nr:alpha-2-macroglobulin [Mediterranea sp.]